MTDIPPYALSNYLFPQLTSIVFNRPDHVSKVREIVDACFSSLFTLLLCIIVHTSTSSVLVSVSLFIGLMVSWPPLCYLVRAQQSLTQCTRVGLLVVSGLVSDMILLVWKLVYVLIPC